MTTIVTIEIVSAVFLGILLITQTGESIRSKSSRLLNLCILLVLCTLVVDAMAYIFMDDSTPFAFRYIVCLLAYIGEGIYYIGFAYYSEAFFSEKTEVDHRLFRIIVIAEIIWIAATAGAFIAGRMVVFENGVEVNDNGYPLFLSIYQIAVMLFIPVLAMHFRKKLGNEAAVLLSVFNITPIFGILAAIFEYYDYSYVLCAVALVFVTEFLQRKQIREQQSDRAAQEALKGNYERIFALEDNFESLYDVELESGHYVSYDRDEFYKSNISDKLVSSSEFFEDLRTNVDRVVYEADRDDVYSFQTREAIIKGLSEKDHVDHYYRIITENGPVWFRMRIVYKDADRKNVIVGVFNAEEEVAANLKEEQFKEQLIQTNARLFALEDNFESLYDVELESGHYDVFVKGDFFRKNVLDKLTVPKDYFKELRENIDAVIYPEDREGLFNTLSRESIQRELSESEHLDYYYRVITEKGPVWFKVRIVYKDAEKKNVIIGVFNASEDVEAKQLEEQKKQLQETLDRLTEALSMAESANMAKTEFLFNMSHDIRTPMNAIIGFTNIAKKEINNPEKALESLEKVKQSSDMLLSLINDVLDMSRIESGKAVPNVEKVDMINSYDNIDYVMATLAESKKVNLEFTLGEMRDRCVYADPTRFNRILINIISNAIKYTPAGGNVRVSAEQIEDTVPGYANYKFVVSDNGIGMSEQFQKRMYDDFTREENSTVSGVQGTGLGLSLVKKLIDMMNGSITCESSQGVGTTFTVILPLRKQTEEEIMESRSAERGKRKVSLKGRKVLLVEDNELNREIAADILSEEGIEVETASDGSVAVNIMKEKGPDYYDFVLMDIQMPVMNGYEATSEIRRMPDGDSVPIIALSANAFKEDIDKSIEAGMNAHVAKPINIEELVAALSKFI